MSLRELVVLGTASQVPTRHRNHNGFFLYWDGHGLLFDPGENMQRQMIHYGVTASQITHILVTHFHGDHCLGLPSVIQRISLDEVQHQVDVVFPASGRVYFDRLRKASIFRDRSRLRPCPVRDPGFAAESSKGAFTIEARPLDHGVDTWGYRLQEPDQWTLDPERLAARGLKGRVVGALKSDGVATNADGETVRVEEVGTLRPGQSAAFVMDTRLCDSAFELAEGVDMLICESTYLHSEQAEAAANGHLTARQAARIASESGARLLVIGHFSQRYQEVEPFLEEASAIHDNVVAVQDGDRVAVPDRKT